MTIIAEDVCGLRSEAADSEVTCAAHNTVCPSLPKVYKCSYSRSIYTSCSQDYWWSMGLAYGYIAATQPNVRIFIN